MNTLRRVTTLPGRRAFCAGVEVDEDGRIVRTAHILGKFHGQPFANLHRWCSANGFALELVP